MFKDAQEEVLPLVRQQRSLEVPCSTVKRVVWGWLIATAFVGFCALTRTLGQSTTRVATSPKDAVVLAARTNFENDALNLAARNLAVGSAPKVYPLRLLFFRHAFSCANANEIAGCGNPDAPILHLSPSEQTALFDKLDEIGSTLPAPKLLPPIDRSFPIEVRGKTYVGKRHPDGFKGNDCMLHLKPRTDNKTQWDEEGGVVPLHHYYIDPVLTQCSKFQNEKAGESFRKWLKQEGIKLDFLGSSLLSRTFQTAYGQLLSDPEAVQDLFSKEMLEGEHAPLVSQLPFVNEFDEVWGYQADDMAWPKHEQTENLLSVLGKDDLEHLDYSHLADFTEEQRVAHDWEAFKENLLGPRLVPFMLKRKGEFSRDGTVKAKTGEPFERAKWGEDAKLAVNSSRRVQPVLNMALASHSGIIKKFCKLETYPFNYAVLEMLLMVEVHDGGATVVVREQSGPCQEVMSGLPLPADLGTDDVANCKFPFDNTQAFVSRGDAAGEKTACEKKALQEGAFHTTPAAKLHAV